MGKYKIEYERKAQGDLKRIKPYHRKRIKPKINLLAHNPKPPKSKELEREYEGSGLRRYSIGKWRVIYEIDDEEKTIYIKEVLLKTGPETYHNLT